MTWESFWQMEWMRLQMGLAVGVPLLVLILVAVAIVRRLARRGGCECNVNHQYLKHKGWEWPNCSSEDQRTPPQPAPPPTSEAVELHQAFMWDCNACGRENFERAVTVEFTPEEAAEQAEAMGEPEAAEDMAGGDWLMTPETVTCKRCGNSFQTREH